MNPFLTPALAFITATLVAASATASPLSMMSLSIPGAVPTVQRQLQMTSVQPEEWMSTSPLTVPDEALGNLRIRVNLQVSDPLDALGAEVTATIRTTDGLVTSLLTRILPASDRSGGQLLEIEGVHDVLAAHAYAEADLAIQFSGFGSDASRKAVYQIKLVSPPRKLSVNQTGPLAAMKTVKGYAPVQLFEIRNDGTVPVRLRVKSEGAAKISTATHQVGVTTTECGHTVQANDKTEIVSEHVYFMAVTPKAADEDFLTAMAMNKANGFFDVTIDAATSVSIGVYGATDRPTFFLPAAGLSTVGVPDHCEYGCSNYTFEGAHGGCGPCVECNRGNIRSCEVCRNNDIELLKKGPAYLHPGLPGCPLYCVDFRDWHQAVVRTSVQAGVVGRTFVDYGALEPFSVGNTFNEANDDPATNTVKLSATRFEVKGQ